MLFRVTVAVKPEFEAVGVTPIEPAILFVLLYEVVSVEILSALVEVESLLP